MSPNRDPLQQRGWPSLALAPSQCAHAKLTQPLGISLSSVWVNCSISHSLAQDTALACEIVQTTQHNTAQHNSCLQH